LLKPLLRRVVPNGVALVDSADSTALTVAGILRAKRIPDNQKSDSTSIQFFVTDSVQKFQRLGKLFLGRPIANITHVELKE
jgi:glutamate racemase